MAYFFVATVLHSFRELDMAMFWFTGTGGEYGNVFKCFQLDSDILVEADDNSAGII